MGWAAGIATAAGSGGRFTGTPACWGRCGGRRVSPPPRARAADLLDHLGLGGCVSDLLGGQYLDTSEVGRHLATSWRFRGVGRFLCATALGALLLGACQPVATVPK